MYLQNLYSKLPANFISNREFCIFTDQTYRPEGFTPDTADQWIFDRSGIRSRTCLNPKIMGSGVPDVGAEVSLAISCVSESLTSLDYQNIDAVITVRSSPSSYVPGLSHRLIKSLNEHFHQKEKSVFALDLFQPSTGALSALVTARGLPFNRILVVISEVLSPLLNLKDPGTSMLFGDAVSSFILTKEETPTSQFEIVNEIFYSVTDENQALSSDHDSQSFKMKGPELFRKAIPEFKKSALQILAKANCTLADVNYYLPHQANRRILERAAHAIGFNTSQVITNIERIGNLSSASMLVALHEFEKSRRLKSGDLILLNACGAGLTAGASLFRMIN